MKAFFFLLIISTCFIACNSENTSATATKDSSTNSSTAFVQIMQKKLQQYPDSTGLRLQYAFALDSVNMFKPAIEQMNILTSKDSMNYGLWYAKGEIAEDGGDTLLALESYSKAAHIYESPDALLSLANLYAEMKSDRAITLCSRVKALSLGRDYDAHCAFIIGVYYARTHKRDQALKYFDECISDNYTYMEAYIEKGLLYFDAKDYRKALNIFQFASTVNSLYADAYYYQGRCYEMMNIKDSAVILFKQSLQIDPTITEARQHIKQLGAE